MIKITTAEGFTEDCLPDTVLNILHKPPPESSSCEPRKYELLLRAFHSGGNGVKVAVSGPEPRPDFLQSPSVNQGGNCLLL